MAASRLGALPGCGGGSDRQVRRLLENLQLLADQPLDRLKVVVFVVIAE